MQKILIMSINELSAEVGFGSSLIEFSRASFVQLIEALQIVTAHCLQRIRLAAVLVFYNVQPGTEAE